MAYNTPDTEVTGALISAADWNILVENFKASAPDVFTTAGDIFVATGANAGERVSVMNASNLIKHEVGGLESDVSSGDGLVQIKGGSTTVVKSNIAASSAPTVNEDTGDGYSIGSFWLDTTNDVAYLCLDAGSGAAVWKNISQGTISALNNATENELVTISSTTTALDSEANLIYDGNKLFLGDSANGNGTVCITVNQGGADDQVFCAKSSDVSHPMTSHVEADTFFAVRRGSDPSGGAMIEGFKDADAEPGHALMLEGTLGEAADTADSSASRGVVEVDARVTNGGTSRAAVASTGNVFVVSTNDTALQVVKGNGDHHVTNTTLTALDDWPDALMGRVGRAAFAPEGSEIRERFSHLIDKYPHLVAKIKEERILIHEEDDPGPGFINVQKGITFGWDMAYQNYEQIQELRETFTRHAKEQEERILELEEANSLLQRQLNSSNEV